MNEPGRIGGAAGAAAVTAIAAPITAVAARTRMNKRNFDPLTPG
jgi:hypothetical protein